MRAGVLSRHGLAVLCGTCLALAGCGGPKAYVRANFLEHPPRRIAVLPFVITYPYDLAEDEAIPDSHRVGREVLRKTFAYALAPYGYDDAKLADVDARLAATWGPLDDGGWQQASPQALGEALGADALIYGEIQRLMHFSTPLYTETSLRASLRMVDASSGEVLWRHRVQVAERGGALIQKGQVVDFLKDQARSFHPEVKFLRVSDVAVRRLLAGFPNPPMRKEQASSPWARAATGQAIRLAILPLELQRDAWRKPAALLRAELVAGLQEGPFELVELQRVDGALTELGWASGEPLPAALAVDTLAEALDADLILRGTVTSWGRVYWILGSWVKTGMALELLEPASGEVIWSARRTNRRQAGLLKGPTGYKSLVTAPLTGLKTSHLERVATHLARSMADELRTAPAVLTYVGERAPATS